MDQIPRHLRNKPNADGEESSTKVLKDHKIAREILEWFLSIVIAVALVMIVHNYIGQLVRVDGTSMEPTLYTNERMVVTKFTYLLNEPQRGDVVVTHFPNDSTNYVKRVIGLPEDKIEIINGYLYINGDKIDEQYILEPMMRDYQEIVLNEGSYFVMGDNRNNSRDSRSVGQINESLIVGKVQAVIWPFSDIKSITHYDYNNLKLVE